MRGGVSSCALPSDIHGGLCQDQSKTITGFASKRFVLRARSGGPSRSRGAGHWANPPTSHPGSPSRIRCLTITAVDPFGQMAVGYLGTVTFSTSDPDPGVVLHADYSFQPSDAGPSDAGQVTFPGGVTLITRRSKTRTSLSSSAKRNIG